MTETNSARWTALDALRGAAVAGMILVTSPGDWNAAYPQLRHADWNGWTVTDMVFPIFLFSVGAALALSFPRPLANREARSQLWWRIGRRALALIALGLVLNWLAELAIAVWVHDPGSGTLGHVRIPGILQRIALCYLLGAGLILATARKDSAGRAEIDARAIGVAIVVILLGYWALMTLVPVPGYGAGYLDPAGNLAAYIDRAIFTPPHMWRFSTPVWGGVAIYDPEGLLSTLPATANLLFGVLAAREWQRSPDRAVSRIALAGLALFVAGLLLDPLFVINKRIWTSSFALLSSGFAAMTLAGLALVLRGPATRLLAPLRVLGGNAILAFVLSQLLGTIGGLPLIGAGGGRIPPQKWGNQVALSVISEPHLASLACAVVILAVITLAIWPLHRRAIHFRL